MDNKKPKRPMTEEEKKEDLRIGLGFNDVRGDSYRQSADIPKHNGLNVHNDPKVKPSKPISDNP